MKQATKAAAKLSISRIKDISNFEELAREHWDSFQNKPPVFNLDALSNFQVIQAEVDGKTVGYILFLIYGSPYYNELWCQTDMFYLQPEHRKQGIGKKMFQLLEQEAKQQGASTLVSSFNIKQPLEGFYHNLGFTQTHMAVAKEI